MEYDAPVINIGNQPIEHYLLNIYSMLLTKQKKFYLRAVGKSINHALNLMNILNNEIFPNFFLINYLTNVVEKDNIHVSELIMEVEINDSGFMSD